MPLKDEFEKELRAQIDRAIRQGRPHVEINAGELHRAVGGYPRPPTPERGYHTMPSCCLVLRKELAQGNAEIIHDTPSGKSAALTIRFHLPR